MTTPAFLDSYTPHTEIRPSQLQPGDELLGSLLRIRVATVEIVDTPGEWTANRVDVTGTYTNGANVGLPAATTLRDGQSCWISPRP